MLNVIHGADFHLDSPFSGLSPQQAAQRRGEQRQLLDRLAQVARERHADLVLLSGDLLDSEQVYRETAQALSRTLGSIPCPVFISPGNHDFFSSRSVYATLDWPENVHIFHTDGFQQAAFPELGCVVHGRAFLDRHWAEDPLAGFHAPKDGLLHLMVLHGEVDGVGQYGPISPASIAESGLTYLALGHIHQYSGLSQTGDTYWAYPGCPEGRGFDELGDKGVLFLQISPETVSAQFLPLARRRYQQLSVDLTGANSPLSALLAALPEDTGADVYRLILTGSCETPDVAGLHRALAPRFYGLQIQDRTHLPQNLWQRREEDTLTGLFLQTMWAKCQAEPDSPVYELAARFGLAALEQGEDVSP